MTKKPPKTLWVNVYKTGATTAYKTKDIATIRSQFRTVDIIGTFKYVLAEKRKHEKKS